MKGYFAPDAIAGLVAVIFVVVIGLLFMNFFTSGLLMRAILQITDVEKPLACELLLYNIVGDEYCREAQPPKDPIFNTAYRYYGGGHNKGTEKIKEKLEATILALNSTKYVNIKCYDVYVGTGEPGRSRCPRGTGCTIPLYSPSGEECYVRLVYKAEFGNLE